MTHEPECDYFQAEEENYVCICDRIRAAYRRGYNDHARSMAMWEATNGGAEVHVHYIQEGAVTHQCPPEGSGVMPCADSTCWCNRDDISVSIHTPRTNP